MKKIALIGLGKMGQTHARSYESINNASLVAVCDMNVEAADALAEKYGIKSYHSVADLLADCDFDVADICTPTFTHLDVIKRAAAAKKHVVCEKPLAISVAEAEEAVRVCKENNVVLFTAHVLRWFPEFAAITRAVKSGSLGDIVTVRTTRGGGYPSSASAWFADFSRSGGVILDLIVHDFDWLRDTLGDVKSVYARGLVDKGYEKMDYALVTLNFKSGAIGHVEGSWMRPGGFVAGVKVCGTKGMIEHNNVRATSVRICKKEGTSVMTPNPAVYTPYRKELKSFIDALEAGRDPAVKPEDALAAVKIACAAIESVKTGKVVEVK
ncbi:MAG: Gfo/Idh/MocA family oxidoreductase [Abditibacteriota bacterium]|nr:Gfo/Idh/MocA family oxidoreductase [Abditibacteriota bacterium]